jgi:DNA-binding IclR family transcriptional regulator
LVEKTPREVGMPQAGREANRIQSVLKALDIMECLAAADRPLSAQDVAQRCSTSRPTAYRYLTTLLDRGYVTTCQNNSHYQIGAQVLGLGKSFLERLDLPELARADLRELSRISQETAHLAVLNGTEMLYIGKVDGPQSVRMQCVIGTRNPLYCTAMGKAVLAYLPAEERAALLDQITLAPRTANTTTDKSALANHLELVRTRGFAIDDMENEEGIRCIGAPIFDHTGAVTAAVSISGPAYRLSDSRVQEFCGLVVGASKAISGKLGYLPGNLQERSE